MLLFAQTDAFWKFASEQTSTVVVVGIFVVAGFKLTQWLVSRYVDPIKLTLNDNGVTLKEIAKSNEDISDKLDNQPSDIPGKLAAAKCPFTKEEVAEIVRQTRSGKQM